MRPTGLVALSFAAVLLSGCAGTPVESARPPPAERALPRAESADRAPAWLLDSESYALGHDATSWEALAASKVAFVTHCPIHREYFERVHALGIRAIPYVSFYYGRADQAYQGLNLRARPELIEVDDKGGLRRSRFWASEDMANTYVVCPNTAAYQEAMVAWVHRIMALGADGIFIDSLGHREPCFGPRFGRHEHLEADQDVAFARLLERVRAAVKQHEPDGVVLGNSAAPLTLPKDFWRHLDADMIESYIVTWASQDRWMSWHDDWHAQGVDLQPYRKAGKQIQALSYLGHTPYGIREDAFFSYASARLAGFAWNGGLPLSNPESAVLYQIRLGRPLGDEQEENGVYFRAFERGLVAVNPSRAKAAPITVGAKVPATKLVDIAGGNARSWSVSGPGSARLAGVGRNGSAGLKLTNPAGVEQYAVQTVRLKQRTATPIFVSAVSRAEDVSGTANANYSIYLDIVYVDGTHLYGQIAPFSPGTHDWEQRSLLVRPEKPIAEVAFNVLLRHRTGTAWFDDVSLREGPDPEHGIERLKNGDFEEEGSPGTLIDLGATRGRLEIPAYAGRVFLYAAATEDELAPRGPKLTVVTRPPLGNVHFRVDGFDYWTHHGRWQTIHVRGPEFGKFELVFEEPGRHSVEIVDELSADAPPPGGPLAPRAASSADGAPQGNRLRFAQWHGSGPSKRIDVDLQGDTTITAEFGRE